MIQKTRTKNSRKAVAKYDDQHSKVWRIRGVEDVYFQRGAQVNFWTVLGGIASAALLTQIPALEQEIRAANWQYVLYFFASLLTIILSWGLTAWGSLVLHWPINLPAVSWMYFGLFAVSVQCLQITQPAGWMTASGIATLCNIVQQINFMRAGAWEAFSDNTQKRLKGGLWIYVGWMFLLFGGAVHLYFIDTVLVETFWGIVVLAILAIALNMQQKGMEQERKELEIP